MRRATDSPPPKIGHLEKEVAFLLQEAVGRHLRGAGPARRLPTVFAGGKMYLMDEEETTGLRRVKRFRVFWKEN